MKKIFFSLLTGTVLTMIFSFAVHLISDYINYPLSWREVEIALSEKKIISTCNVEGSLIKVICKNDSYFALFYEIAFMTNRYRSSLVQVDINDISSTIVSGRWTYFIVIIDGVNISCEPSVSKIRPLPFQTFFFIIMSLSSAIGVHKTIL